MTVKWNGRLNKTSSSSEIYECVVIFRLVVVSSQDSNLI